VFLICNYLTLIQPLFLLDFLRLRNSDDIALEGIASFSMLSYIRISTLFHSFRGGKSSFPICLEMKHANHDLSLRFSIRMTGDEQ
jgi:hypothetical protein